MGTPAAVEFRFHGRKIFCSKREVVDGRSFRTLGGFRFPQDQKDPGQLQQLERTGVHDLRAEDVHPDLLMGVRVPHHHVHVASGHARGIGRRQLRSKRRGRNQEHGENGPTAHGVLLSRNEFNRAQSSPTLVTLAASVGRSWQLSTPGRHITDRQIGWSLRPPSTFAPAALRWTTFAGRSPDAACQPQPRAQRAFGEGWKRRRLWQRKT